jgi:hypothetical protein
MKGMVPASSCEFGLFYLNWIYVQKQQLSAFLFDFVLFKRPCRSVAPCVFFIHPLSSDIRMNSKQHRGLFVALSLLLFTFGCQREIQQELDEKQGPTVAAQQSETYVSRGFQMTVNTNQVHAVINTQNVPIPTREEDQVLTYGPDVAPLVFSGETYSRIDQNGDELIYDLLQNPSDGRTYWAVPFDKNKPPIKVADQGNFIIIIGLLSCRCGSNTSACYPVGTGCGTSVCANCSTDIIIIIIEFMSVLDHGGLTPYTLVAAESIDFNGTIYN